MKASEAIPSLPAYPKSTHSFEWWARWKMCILAVPKSSRLCLASLPWCIQWTALCRLTQLCMFLRPWISSGFGLPDHVIVGHSALAPKAYKTLKRWVVVRWLLWRMSLILASPASASAIVFRLQFDILKRFGATSLDLQPLIHPKLQKLVFLPLPIVICVQAAKISQIV